MKARCDLPYDEFQHPVIIVKEKPPKQPTVAQLKLQLWKVQLAFFSMERVIELCHDMMTLNPAPESSLYHGMMAAICLEYARPFAADSRSGLGSLSEKFERFQDPSFKEIHDELKSARKNHYAHFSQNHQEVLFSFGTSMQNGKEIVNLKFGRLDEHLSPKNIGKIDELVKFQMGRLQEERNSLAVSLFRAGQVQAGVYALVPRGEIVLEPRPDLFVSDKPCWLEKPSSKNT